MGGRAIAIWYNNFSYHIRNLILMLSTEWLVFVNVSVSDFIQVVMV